MLRKSKKLNSTQVLVIQKIKKRYEQQKNKIIKKVLKKYFNIDEYILNYTQNGKPYLENKNVFFSISNDNDILVMCFDVLPVGIDIQFYKEVPKSLKKLLNFGDISDKETVIKFSQKEAVIKLLGETLNKINEISLNDYNISSYIKRKYVINIATYRKN